MVHRVALLLALAILAAPAAAQDKTNAENPPIQAPQANWATNCAAVSRSGPIDCTVEQRVVLKTTGQQLARFQVRVPGSEPRAPAMLVQVPLGLSIKAGVHLAIDGQDVSRLEVQTCDANGCYAGAPIAPEMLYALRSGKELTVGFHDLQTKPISVSLQLAGFSDAYAKIE